MVDVTSDEEQLERLKEWWQQNWLPIVLGLGLSVSAVLGWNFWKAHKADQAEVASGHFEQLQVALQVGDISKASEQSDLLVTQYRGTPYAAQGALLLAKGYLGSKDLDAAANQLEWVANYADDSKVQHVGRLRLAKVRWAQGETENALDLLQTAKLDSFIGIYAELRGDILASQKRVAEAREAYQQAMEKADVSDLAALQQKLSDLVEEGASEEVSDVEAEAKAE